jgi:hypothetical protein
MLRTNFLRDLLGHSGRRIQNGEYYHSDDRKRHPAAILIRDRRLTFGSAPSDRLPSVGWTGNDANLQADNYLVGISYNSRGQMGYRPGGVANPPDRHIATSMTTLRTAHTPGPGHAVRVANGCT